MDEPFTVRHLMAEEAAELGAAILRPIYQIRPSSPADLFVAEIRRLTGIFKQGCSNSYGKEPCECEECTREFAKAIVRAADCYEAGSPLVAREPNQAMKDLMADYDPGMDET